MVSIRNPISQNRHEFIESLVRNGIDTGLHLVLQIKHHLKILSPGVIHLHKYLKLKMIMEYLQQDVMFTSEQRMLLEYQLKFK